LLVAFCKVENNIGAMLKSNIKKTPELKKFMVTHSIFDVSTKKRRDWLQRIMINILKPTQKELYEWFHPKSIPEELLYKFKIFEPEQIILEIDPIKIQYGMWRKGSNGRLVDPIHIIYEDFEGIKFLKQEEVAKELAKYQEIESDPVIINHDDWLIEDDLPF